MSGEREFRADLRKAFEDGAAGVPPTPSEGYWHTVGFIAEDDILDFEPIEEEVKRPTHLGEIQHKPLRDHPAHIIHELQEAPIVDAVIIDDGETSK